MEKVRIFSEDIVAGLSVCVSGWLVVTGTAIKRRIAKGTAVHNLCAHLLGLASYIAIILLLQLWLCSVQTHCMPTLYFGLPYQSTDEANSGVTGSGQCGYLQV